MDHPSEDIRVDYSALGEFDAAMSDSLDAQLVPNASKSMPSIECAASAVGNDGRFTEAADVRAAGDRTTVSAHSFLDRLTEQVKVLGADAREARERYRTMDRSAAESDVMAAEQVRANEAAVVTSATGDPYAAVLPSTKAWRMPDPQVPPPAR